MRDGDAETLEVRRGSDPRPHPGAGPALTISVTRTPTPPRPTVRVGRICLEFGASPSPHPVRIVDHLALHLAPATITFISGPSGSGKSAILQAVEQRFPRAHAVHRASLPAGRSIVDAIGEHRDLADTVRLLSACGMSEPALWLRSYDELSEGEQFRVRLARCIDLHQLDGAGGPLLCDEFCAALHSRLARAIAFNLRKLATRLKLSFILAAARDDLTADLQPDQVVQFDSVGRVSSFSRRPQARPISLRRGLVIEPGGKRDYLDFKPMHYRAGDELGFVDRIFVLKHAGSGDKLAIVVYCHPPLELALRNRALPDYFKGHPDLLNMEMRILRRLVVHPDVRGCGLGHYLIRRTLLLLDVPFVECLASMGEFNPVFEKAGMKRIGRCAVPAARLRLMDELAALGADPFGPDFVNHVGQRPQVRELVAGLVTRWYRATTGGGDERVAHQSPEFLAQLFRGLVATRPVYYLWQRGD